MSSIIVREFLRSTSFSDYSEDEHEDPLEFVTSRFSKDRDAKVNVDGIKSRRTKRDSQCQLRSSDTIFEHEYKYRSGKL